MFYQPGAVLHQRYRVVKLLGQGGFGALYRVWDITLARPCALKQNLDASQDMQRQFLREAKILANLSHPNLPRVTDYFVDGSSQYLVMDYIEGQDLQEMLDDRRGPLPEDQSVGWIRQICDALAYLHTQKPPVIHRDIKPGNIKITPSGQAVLVDFGIAKVYDPGSKTTLGAQAVTPGFSPYEQYGQAATDARSDIYALGATLYTLLTGQEPPESVQRVTRDSIRLPRQLNPNISVRVSSAVMRALQMDPTQRFQSAADFKAGLSIPARPAAPARVPAPPASVAQPFYSTKGAGSAALPGKIPWGILILLGGLALVLALLVVVGNIRRTPAPQATAALEAASTAAMPATEPSRPAPSPAFTPNPTTTPATVDYVVQVGDTCSEIASRYRVRVAQVAALNGLPADCGIIFAGQKLRIPVSDGNLPGEISPSGAPPVETRPPASPTAVKPAATRVSQVDGMVQVYVTGGEFQMGATTEDSSAGAGERPLHRVYLSAFWIDRTEITNVMYAACVRAGACRPPADRNSKTRPEYFGEQAFEDYPVLFVAWQDANDYCAWAERRLPSEAEWEKAARGVDARLYPWGEAPPASHLANFDEQVGDTLRVGSLPGGASPYGALDMAGNVSEWVADWYDDGYYHGSPSSNPGGPQSGEFRVLRGGSWFNPGRALRAAFRLWNYPGLRSDSVGFRCAR